MEFVRYLTGLLVFLGSSFVIAFIVHLILMRRMKRKDAALSERGQ